jgi:threonine/homoserine/homoserine lactone efflux protein
LALLDMSGLRSTRTVVKGKLPSHFRAVRSGGRTDLFRPIRLLKQTFSLTKPPKSADVISETRGAYIKARLTPRSTTDLDQDELRAFRQSRSMDPIVFVAASVTLLITPGPTNTLLATSGAIAGVRRSLPLLVSEVGGYLAAILILRLLAAPAIAAAPAIEPTLRILVSAYLLYLALRLWQQGSAKLNASGPVTFGRVLMTTLLNPKGIIFAFTILPQNKGLVDLVPWLVALALMILAIGGLWIAIGASLRDGFQGRITPTVVYRMSALALTLLAGAVSAHAFM